MAVGCVGQPEGRETKLVLRGEGSAAKSDIGFLCNVHLVLDRERFRFYWRLSIEM